jgi:hypothetical protein
MHFLKRAWQLWSDVLTFDWLDRLSTTKPRLAKGIRGMLICLGLGLLAWYYLDPRFVIVAKYSYEEVHWRTRIILGSVCAIASIGVAVYTLFSLKSGEPKVLARSLTRKQHMKRKKQR